MKSCGARRQPGFTLVELMIVVAVLGTLAVIAIPRFAQTIRKSKEGRARANLTALRDSIQLYYGENLGILPLQYMDPLTVDTGTFVAVLVPKYMRTIPESQIGVRQWDESLNNAENFVETQYGWWPYVAAAPEAAWYYDPEGGGKIWVGNSGTDLMNRAYSSW